MSTVHALDGRERPPLTVPCPTCRSGRTIKVHISFANENPNTIWNRLAARLGRMPTDREAAEEVRRILADAPLLHGRSHAAPVVMPDAIPARTGETPESSAVPTGGAPHPPGAGDLADGGRP